MMPHTHGSRRGLLSFAATAARRGRAPLFDSALRMEVSVQRSGWTRWRRRFIILLLLAGAAVLVATYTVYQNSKSAEILLAEAIAEADRLDPNWRIDDLEASRERVPDEENSALAVPSVGNGMTSPPKPWYQGDNWPDEELQRLLDDVDPERAFDEMQCRALALILEDVEPTLIECRRLSHLPHGRHLIAYARDGISTLLPHIQRNREIAMIVHYDALLRAQEGDIDGALASSRACLNAGRSVGDEPLLISMLVRLGIRHEALDLVERVLAQGQASQGALETLQRLLEDEESMSLLLIGLRGERAISDRIVQHLYETGGKTLVQRARLVHGLRDDDPSNKKSWYSVNTEEVRMMMPDDLKRQRAAVISYMTKAVEIAKLPLEQQPARFKELERSVPDLPMLARLMGPAIPKIAPTHFRSQALIRCTIAAVALERYRLLHGYWPSTLFGLTPALLKAVPLDPFDAQALRYRLLPDGVIVYSVGPDGVDNGGTMNRQNLGVRGTDIGVRLWDVSSRRQPPKPTIDQKSEKTK